MIVTVAVFLCPIPILNFILVATATEPVQVALYALFVVAAFTGLLGAALFAATNLDDHLFLVFVKEGQYRHQDKWGK